MIVNGSFECCGVHNIAEADICTDPKCPADVHTVILECGVCKGQRRFRLPPAKECPRGIVRFGSEQFPELEAPKKEALQ